MYIYTCIYIYTYIYIHACIHHANTVLGKVQHVCSDGVKGWNRDTLQQITTHCNLPRLLVLKESEQRHTETHCNTL